MILAAIAYATRPNRGQDHENRAQTDRPYAATAGYATMSGMAKVLLVLGAAALVVAAFLTAGDVTNSEGAICGSAWRSSRRTIVVSGERTPVQVEAAFADCERAGDRAMAKARVAAVAGIVLLGAGGVAIATRRHA